MAARAVDPTPIRTRAGSPPLAAAPTDILTNRQAAGLPVTSKVAKLGGAQGAPGQAPRSAATLWGRWVEEAWEAGFDVSGLAQRLTGQARTRPIRDADIDNAFDKLASAQGLTAQASTFGRMQVIRALGDMGLFGPHDLEPLADRFLAERCVRVATHGRRRPPDRTCS